MTDPTKEIARAATQAILETKTTVHSERNSKRLPPYGKQFMSIRESGKVPSKTVMVSFDWDLAQAYPRIIIPAGANPAEIEFKFLAGLPVQIIYRNKDAHRVDALVQEIMRVNPCLLATFALDLVDTAPALTLIKPYHTVEQAEAA
ncbi:hypothetical protein C8R31_101125 [Nitrosospira sp. Nsp2]|uniref:hypothetical protein n=1 Tax=Nitrosospira sp. Nsp2 TaxID=136548 RepID=UPI000D30B794|nr:hypothetical protein [Nitrosospira sp. Nsp2]PTR16972.1 hypothetical protein C8R31_101125 [Nitrosospira sp. Nsp2]